MKNGSAFMLPRFEPGRLARLRSPPTWHPKYYHRLERNRSLTRRIPVTKRVALFLHVAAQQFITERIWSMSSADLAHPSAAPPSKRDETNFFASWPVVGIIGAFLCTFLWCTFLLWLVI